MKNLTNDEINRILAEFEGAEKWSWKETDISSGQREFDITYILQGLQFRPYTENLNATARVWEKFGMRMIHIGTGFYRDVMGISFQVRPDKLKEPVSGFHETNLTIAAAHATALAILELQKENNEN